MARPRLDLADYLPYLINRVGSALVARFTADALARHGLTIATWRVLVTLSQMGPLRQIDLADHTTIEVSTLSRLVTRLARAGLVTRARSRNSNREVTVRVTPKAEALLAELIPIARRLERTAIAGLSAAELRVAKESLRRIHRNLAG
ncbi:MAG: MarR family transcriptional regulator [Xanthobacteraceae bacterium]|nr:MarR family transcriptional regulator [Xanthobacteraceae bacterium]PWB61435.1 MAG: MarR family transcriptional regulator [Bradyrhizobiaceae bacterium]